MKRRYPLIALGIFFILWGFLMIIMMWLDDAFDDEIRWAGLLVNIIIASVCFHYSQKNLRPRPDNIEEYNKTQRQNKEKEQDSSLEILKKRYASGEISEDEFNKMKANLNTT